MTLDQLNELERLANAATPGPWKCREALEHYADIAGNIDNRAKQTLKEVFGDNNLTPTPSEPK